MPAPSVSYTVTPVLQEKVLSDIHVDVQGKRLTMLGPGGPARECHALATFFERCTGERPTHVSCNGLPVLLGSGIGAALAELLAGYDGPVAVIDKETAIFGCTGVNRNIDDRVLWLSDEDPNVVLQKLTHWQLQHGGLPLVPLPLTFYLRLDRSYYGQLREDIGASDSYDFWARAKYAKFTTEKPRILLITSQYFLMGEIINACKRMDIPVHLLTLEDDTLGQTEFVEQLLTAVVEFKPDFVFTINHLGVDRQGVLVNLLERLELPLASWFVDNPHLILYLYEQVISPWTVIFTWDTDNIPTLREMGFEHIQYLSLGTDHHRFAPPARLPAVHPFRQDVAFVGNSMVYKVAYRMKVARPSRELLRSYKKVALGFAEHEERSVSAYLAKYHPSLYAAFTRLDTVERKLAYESMITWEATRLYRARCVEQILPFSPVIYGDRGWNRTFPHSPHAWHTHQEVSYYDELPMVYPLTTVNFNCTSKQMKGAVNQRVFDVPAAGAFVLTDYREQITELFDPGTEVICYHEPEEIPELLEYYLTSEADRKRVITAARKRILAEHTYEHRITSLIDSMRRIFGA